jgi:sugar-specific transcriptional regulator TrmB
MKDLKEKLEELELEVKVLLSEDCDGEEYYLNVNNKIDVMEGAYQKWDTYIEEEDKEVSFMNDEDLIEYIKGEAAN